MRKLAGAAFDSQWIHLATAYKVAVSPNPSASLIWSPMILLNGVITNAEYISPFASWKKLKYEACQIPWVGQPKFHLHLLVVLSLSALI